MIGNMWPKWFKVNIARIDPLWRDFFILEAEKEYFQKLLQFVFDEYVSQIIYPPKELIFNAFEKCAYNDVKVVILGQDPYHGEDQAHGLSFSVTDNTKIPPSLRNIFKEIDHVDHVRKNGDLTYLAQQGVLLLNSVLTVRAGKAGSHQSRGWEVFTNAVIKKISSEKENVVFMLWGAYAKEKSALIDSQRHFILESAHPSPFSAHKGFLGNNHFEKANVYLENKSLKKINWNSW